MVGPDAEAELHLCRMMNLGDEVAFDACEDEAAVLPEAAGDANHRIEIVEPRGFVEREIACVVDVAEHVAVRPARHQLMEKTEIRQCRPLAPAAPSTSGNSCSRAEMGRAS